MNKLDFKLLTGRSDNHLKNFDGYLIHKDVTTPFSQLQKLAQNEIGADLKIISSFRSFDRQKLIWNEKALGIRKVLDDHGNLINAFDISEDELLMRILRFSAIPGASRHHWGTDFDIFDAHKLNKEQVELIPNEWDEQAPFSELNLWLMEKISQDKSFGFFRPYENDLGGIAPECWHLSFAPLADGYFEQYDLAVFQENINQSDFELKGLIQKETQTIYERFIRTITQK